MSAALTRRQREALEMLQRARSECPSTDDGLTLGGAATFYDVEVSVARIHWRTADALKHRGLIEYGDWDPDWGTEIRLLGGWFGGHANRQGGDVSEVFTGNRKRLWWAMYRADWPMEKRGVWLNMPLSIDDARTLATAAHVPLAALYLPDPTFWESFKAWWYGKTVPAGRGQEQR